MRGSTFAFCLQQTRVVWKARGKYGTTIYTQALPQPMPCEDKCTEGSSVLCVEQGLAKRPPPKPRRAEARQTIGHVRAICLSPPNSRSPLPTHNHNVQPRPRQPWTALFERTLSRLAWCLGSRAPQWRATSSDCSHSPRGGAQQQIKAKQDQKCNDRATSAPDQQRRTTLAW